MLTPIVGGFNRTDTEELIQSVAREVEVTRRLYRSGESEYLIDGEVCRLKDIYGLLMDTGLGAKAYAIIEQDKIGMMLSSRPTDRRQLIEEAAGITKYRTRRRAADLKLEAARQNLTRVDDIVFEVERQRGTLKRQAAKARRYQKLRDELRQWEKILFSRKYRQLAEVIESARARLETTRERELLAAARLAEVENDLGRRRFELVEAESLARNTREDVHACELAINRQQQQLVFDREQIHTLDTRAVAVAAEREVVDARREPARTAIAGRRTAAAEAFAERDRAAATLASESEAYEAAHREIEGMETDVEAARSEVFSALHSATALRHALGHAAAAWDRVAETLAKLDIETDDVRVESARVETDRTTAAAGLARAHAAIEVTGIARSARESELDSARIEHELRARSVRAHEHDLAGLEARLKSLKELEVARAGYSDAPRAVLAQANCTVNQRGAVADYLEVEAGYERAVEACLGDLLQHIVVERPEHAAAGFKVVREAAAGRCGFLIASGSADTQQSSGQPAPAGVIALSSIVRVNGPFAAPIRDVIGDAWVAGSYGRAEEVTALTSLPVVTMDGDIFRSPRLVSGGGREDARGILETKREIRELRERIQDDRDALSRIVQEAGVFEAAISHASDAVAALNAERHNHEKAIVGHNAQLQHAIDEATRLGQKSDQLALERRQAEEERQTLDRRQEEVRDSIARLDDDQRAADERLTVAQRRFLEVREAAEDLSRRVAEACAAHAALVERAAALLSEERRLEEAAADLEERASALSTELQANRQCIDVLRAAVVTSAAQLDSEICALDTLRIAVQTADDEVSTLRIEADAQETAIKAARGVLEAIRAARGGARHRTRHGGNRSPAFGRVLCRHGAGGAR